MKEKKRVGIYGGTFSPPHIGHVNAAEQFSRQLSLDRLLIVPARIPPHKEADRGATPKERLQMCRMAFAGVPAAEVSDIELNRSGKSYTVLTLRELAAPDTDLYFLVGTDMFLTLDTWYCAPEIFRLSVIVLIRRENEEINNELIREKEVSYRRDYSAKIIVLNVPSVPVSSSEIRQKLAVREPVGGFLCTEVEAYIRQWHLYQPSTKKDF